MTETNQSNEQKPSNLFNFSHSKLDVARSCWKKFKYQYIDHAKGIETRDAADFGEVCHYISENYKGNGKEELLALYHSYLKEKKIVLNSEYKKRVPLALKNIHSHWENVLKGLPLDNIKKEENVEIQLTETIKLNGKIDILIKRLDSTYLISDLKTSKNNKYADHRNQLSMYMLLLHKKYNIPYEDMDTDIIYLSMVPEDKNGNKILNEGYENIHKIYKLDEVDVECLISEIQTIEQQIIRNKERDQWKAKPTKFGCGFCKFKHLCKDKFVE